MGLASTLVACALAMAFSQSSLADMGTCQIAAPTTSSVHVIVSDLDRSVRWYRDHVGLKEIRRWNDPSIGGATLVLMERQNAGLTLMSYPELNFHSLDPQMVCFALEGNPSSVNLSSRSGRHFCRTRTSRALGLVRTPVVRLATSVFHIFRLERQV